MSPEASDASDPLPASLSARTAYLLGQAAAQAHALGEEDLAPLGITPREYSVLAVLADQSPLTQTRIAEILGFDRTTILKLGAGLERKGLVVRAHDEHDRRAYAVGLTPSGDRLRGRAQTLLLKCEERFLAPLPADQQDQLHALLARVIGS
jgi:DNA-binding MarR family transcriptional regulator